MRGMDVSLIRNIGIVAHIDAGKTTTTERFLYYTGKNHKLGEVHDGAATMDWMVQEQERGITITSAATTCFWKKNDRQYQINIIDTPGHIDFGIEVERSLRVLDGAIVVLCAVAGIQPQTETVWKQSEKFSIPKLVFVNKLDRVGADFFAVVQELKETLFIEPVCVNIPMYEEESFCGVIDLIKMKAVLFDEETLGLKYEIVDIPDSYQKQALAEREKMLDSLSRIDDTIVEKLLDNKEVLEAEIIKAMREGACQRVLVPVLCGAAFKNKGIQLVLDALVDFLPSPKDIDYSLKENREDYDFQISADAPLVSLVFKTQKDKYSGVFSYVRLYQGSLETGKVYYLNKKKKERIANIYRMHAVKRESVARAEAGEIVAVSLSQARTGDTLAAKGVSLLLENIKAFQPVISMAVETKTKENLDKLSQSLAVIEQEDLSFKVVKDKETGQLLISGMGELHLEVIKDKLLREHKLDIVCGKPQVSYRESVSKTGEQTAEFHKILAGESAFAKCTLRLEKNEEKEEAVFENKAIIQHPQKEEILKSIEDAIEKSTRSGVIGGYPVIRVKTTLLELETGEGNVNPQAFAICASQAFRECLLGCGAYLLSPVMALHVYSPAEYLGDVINDLNARKAKVESIAETKNEQVIRSYLHLTNLFGYTTTLRSLSKGKAYHSAEFAYFESVSDEGFDNLH